MRGNKEENKENKEKRMIEAHVSDMMRRLRIPANIRGYHYLRDALIMTYGNRDMLEAVTKELYPAVAGLHGTTAGCVERAMRYAIDAAWKNCGTEAGEEFFCRSAKCGKKPSNSEFIATLADRMRIELEDQR